MSDLLDDPATEAAKKGLLLIEPGPREVFLDLDTDHDEDRYQAAKAIMERNGESFTEIKRTISAGGNTHVHVEIPPTWPDLDPLTRVTVQACFGSDHVRESLSLLRIKRGYTIPATCFFEVPDTTAVLTVGGDDIPF